MGFDDIIFSQYNNPPLTTIAVPREELGGLAFQALWEMLEDGDRQGKEIQVQTYLKVRQSSGPVP